MRLRSGKWGGHLVTYGLYPLLLLFMLGYAWLETSGQTQYTGQYYIYYLTLLFGILLLVEFVYPLRNEWRMTWKTFSRRDVPYMLLGGLVSWLSQICAGWIVIHLGLTRGTSHAQVSMLAGVIIILLTGDFLWYWVHRLCHEGKGRLGRWLWKMHVAHHLPGQVYLFMHAVAHPVNFLIVRIILVVPFYFLGFSTDTLFVANLIIGLQGLVSHFNVDIRAGWLNYLLIGTELHRYHHSADFQESKNYGATVSIWDLLFGTFVYKPDTAPAQLGVTQQERYPKDGQIIKMLVYPFR